MLANLYLNDPSVEHPSKDVLSDILVIDKMGIVHKKLALRFLFSALMKAELRRLFTLKFEMDILFILKATHSLGILMILSAIM